MPKDKVCLITGATSGIGRATAISLARRGTTLLLVSRTGEYFFDKKKIRSSALSYDRDVARRLWKMSAEMIGLQADLCKTGGVPPDFMHSN